VTTSDNLWRFARVEFAATLLGSQWQLHAPHPLMSQITTPTRASFERWHVAAKAVAKRAHASKTVSDSHTYYFRRVVIVNVSLRESPHAPSHLFLTVNNLIC